MRNGENNFSAGGKRGAGQRRVRCENKHNGKNAEGREQGGRRKFPRARGTNYRVVNFHFDSPVVAKGGKLLLLLHALSRDSFPCAGKSRANLERVRFETDFGFRR